MGKVAASFRSKVSSVCLINGVDGSEIWAGPESEAEIDAPEADSDVDSELSSWLEDEARVPTTLPILGLLALLTIGLPPLAEGEFVLPDDDPGLLVITGFFSFAWKRTWVFEKRPMTPSQYPYFHIA